MSDANRSLSTSLELYDHVRPTDDVLAPGVYRVVGASSDAVTLLRVADAEGHRRNTGEVVIVAREDWSSLEPAANPDGNRPLTARLATRLDGAWWSLRVIGRTVTERPAPSAVALAFVAVGLFGDPYVPVPDSGDALLVVGGALSLVYLSRTGSGR